MKNVIILIGVFLGILSFSAFSVNGSIFGFSNEQFAGVVALLNTGKLNSSFAYTKAMGLEIVPSSTLSCTATATQYLTNNQSLNSTDPSKFYGVNVTTDIYVGYAYASKSYTPPATGGTMNQSVNTTDWPTFYGENVTQDLYVGYSYNVPSFNQPAGTTGNVFNQSVNTTDWVTFLNQTVTDDMYVGYSYNPTVPMLCLTSQSSNISWSGGWTIENSTNLTFWSPSSQRAICFTPEGMIFKDGCANKV